jgi:hypothetical protein
MVCVLGYLHSGELKPFVAELQIKDIYPLSPTKKSKFLKNAQ